MNLFTKNTGFVFFLPVLLLFSVNLRAQTEVPEHSQLMDNTKEKDSTSQVTHSIYGELGGNYSYFQDKEVMNFAYTGFGTKLNLGYMYKTETYDISSGLDAILGGESATTNSIAENTLISGYIYSKYMYNIYPNLAIGAQWNLINMNVRTVNELGNNDTHLMVSSDLLFSSSYSHEDFIFSLNLGLFSFVNEFNAFGFKAPQNVITDGNFSYQLEKGLSLFLSPEYFSFKYMFNHLLLNFSTYYNFSDALQFGYLWDIRRLSEVTNYPLTYGNHQLTLKYNLTF